jgi:hypothetical protein
MKKEREREENICMFVPRLVANFNERTEPVLFKNDLQMSDYLFWLRNDAWL